MSTSITSSQRQTGFRLAFPQDVLTAILPNIMDELKKRTDELERMRAKAVRKTQEQAVLKGRSIGYVTRHCQRLSGGAVRSRSERRNIRR